MACLLCRLGGSSFHHRLRSTHQAKEVREPDENVKRKLGDFLRNAFASEKAGAYFKIVRHFRNELPSKDEITIKVDGGFLQYLISHRSHPLLPRRTPSFDGNTEKLRKPSSALRRNFTSSSQKRTLLRPSAMNSKGSANSFGPIVSGAFKCCGTARTKSHFTTLSTQRCVASPSFPRDRIIWIIGSIVGRPSALKI